MRCDRRPDGTPPVALVPRAGIVEGAENDRRQGPGSGRGRAVTIDSDATTGELRGETRDKILEGARQAISVHGLKRVGMSDVSDAAGVSRGTLYRYFPSREQLLD